MDVLAGAADNLTRQMRGGYPPDGHSAPADNSVPTPFVPLRAGFIRILRLRLVDGYGQFLDLAGSSDTAILNSADLIGAASLQTPGRPELLAMPPRFTSPARLWFRYMAADGSPDEADATISPVCGFLMPNHLDGDLEFFDATGANLGFVRPDPQAGVIWEDAPGVPSTVGQSPARAIPNQFAAGVAQGLLQWGLADATNTGLPEDALSAMLRIIDSTLWAVDPFGSSTDEHLSLLVGHPVAILRAHVHLEVQEPIDPSLINTKSVSLRLGAIPQWQDGLLGYFVNDDYTRLYCADAAIAGFAREVGPGQGFLQQASLVPDYYQTFSDDIGDTVTQGASPRHPPLRRCLRPAAPFSPTRKLPSPCWLNPTRSSMPPPGSFPAKTSACVANGSTPPSPPSRPPSASVPSWSIPKPSACPSPTRFTAPGAGITAPTSPPGPRIRS